MNIVFFGTSNRSLPILESIKENFNLVLCITKTDQKTGRKQELKECEVKTWAKKNSIKFLEVSSFKNENLDTVLETLEEIKPDYGIVADFSFMIPISIINYFKNNLINIHFSMLPKYRGASPVQFSILNGDPTGGITYYLIDKELDHGPILYQEEYKISETDTSGSLYEKLFLKAAESLPKVINDYTQKKLNPVIQDESKAIYTYSKSHPNSTQVFKEDAEIGWNSASLVERQIRAYNPWPIAWTYISKLEENSDLIQEEKIELKRHINRNLKVKIYKAYLIDKKLKIIEIQVEGKNRTNWISFKNGYLV